MAFPDDPIPFPDWLAGGVTPAMLQAKITDRFNALLGAFQMENDRTVLTVPSGSNLADLPITFAKTWAAPPNVQVTVQSAVGRFAAYLPVPVTTSGFTVRGYVYNGANVGSDANITIAWLAVAAT